MKTKHLLALAALVTVQAYAAGPVAPANSVPPGAFSGPLTATADPSTPGQFFFKQALTGDTQKCVIDISYGEPGVLPNNDGPTHLNGLSSLDRVRTYKTSGTYTFTAKAVSGCTGSSRVSFTVGSGKTAGATALPVAAAPAPAANPATSVDRPAPVIGNVSSNLNVAHTVITKLEAPTKLAYGAPLTVKVFGTGIEANCHTMIDLIKVDDKGNWLNTQRAAVKAGTGAWPRVDVFTVGNVDKSKPLERGHYMVHLSIVEQDQNENMACTKNLAVPGQNTFVYIGEDIPK